MRPMRGYLKTAAMSAGDVGDTPLFVIDYALRILRVLVLLALWRTILGGREPAGPMSLQAVLTYTVIAEVFAEQLAVRTTLSLAFWEGTLVIRFLRPMGMIRQLATEMAGKWLISLALFSVPLVLLAPALGVDPRPSSLFAAALFIPSLALAILVGLALDLLFGAITVALEQPVWVIEYTRTAVATLLSGALLPLAYYPWGLGDVFSWLPFAAMAWAPLAIYTGTGSPLPLLASQFLWAALLWPVADWLWRNKTIAKSWSAMAVESPFKRLIDLWRLYATMDLLFLARGPQVALTYYVSDFVVGLAAITATFLLAERFDGIGPWTRPEVLFLLGYALLVRGLIDIFFNYNLAFVSRRIGRGQLDHVLIQPQPLWMMLLTEGFAPVTGSGMFVPGLGLLLWAASQLHLDVPPTWYLLLVVDLAASIAVVLAFEYIVGSLAFWAPRAAEEINSSSWRLITQLAPFPLDGLAGWALGGLITVVPVGLVAWYPARVLLANGITAWESALLPVIALGLSTLAFWIFRRGLRHYGRTGSTRYLDYGHRR